MANTGGLCNVIEQSSTHSVPLLFLHQAHQEGDDGHDQKDEKQNLGNTYGAGRNPAETENCSDQGNHQKDNGVVQHGFLLSNAGRQALPCGHVLTVEN